MPRVRARLAVLFVWMLGFVAVANLAPEQIPAYMGLTVVLSYLGGGIVLHRRVRRDPGLEPIHRRIMSALLWLAPIIGLMVVVAFYRSQDERGELTPERHVVAKENDFASYGGSAGSLDWLLRPSWHEQRAASRARRRAYVRAREACGGRNRSVSKGSD